MLSEERLKYYDEIGKCDFGDLIFCGIGSFDGDDVKELVAEIRELRTTVHELEKFKFANIMRYCTCGIFNSACPVHNE